MMNAATYQSKADKRDRALITPEGLSLPLTVASRGARAGALLLDLTFIFGGILVFFIAMALAGLSLFAAGTVPSSLGELLIVIVIIFLFLARYGYFLAFELGARGATPGKRLLGIRVAARDGGKLSADMVIARNLVRDIELILPGGYLLTIMFGGGSTLGVSGWALVVWLLIFVLFPFTNKDALRAGDLVAGTWVVEARQAKLPDAMSLAPDRTATYRFGPEELSVYGEHELQVLESVLRAENPRAMAEVAETICRKIGWQMGSGDEREFLESFYQALRGHLEGGMRFGKRKANKHS